MFRLSMLLSMLSLPALAAAPDAGAKPRVAVLYFEPATTDADLAAFTKGIAELLISDFTANPGLVVLERERLEDALKELNLGESKYADKSTFGKIGKVLGVEYLVVGRLMCVGKAQCRISAHAISFPLVQTVASSTVTMDPGDVYSATDKLIAELSQKLVALGSVAAWEPPPELKKTHKLPLSTGVKYAKALDAKDKKDKATQKKLLSEVVKEQPDFKLAQLDLLSLRD